MAECGGVVVNLNWRQPPATPRALAAGLRCSLVVAGRGLAPMARTIAAACAASALLLVEGAEAELAPLEPGELAFSCASLAPPHAAVGSAEPDDVAVVMFTSGTTALPKAVPLTHRGLLWSCDAKRRAEQEALNLSLAAHEGSLAFLPSFHVIGFTNNFLCNLRHGTRCLLHHDAPTTPTSAPLLLRAATELRPSLIDTVPVLLEAMLPLDADTIATLRACKAVMYGGAPLSHAAWIEMRKNGICVLSQYGQTELGGMALIGSGMAPYGGLAPVPGVTAALEPASEGNLVLTGVQSLTPGYWPLDPPEAGAAGAAPARPPPRANAPGAAWPTGDVFRSEGGKVEFKHIERAGEGDQLSPVWLRHVCRADELLVHTSGEMTNPLPIEEALMTKLGRLATGCVVFGAGRGGAAAVIELAAHAPLPDSPPASPPPAAADDAGAAAASEARLTPAELWRAVQAALDAANAGAPEYSRLPSKLVRLVHPALDEPLARTAKGGIVRRHVDARFGGWLDETLAASRATAAAAVKAAKEGGGGGGGGGDASVVVDSMGLAALVGGAGGGGGECGGGPLLSPEEATLDFVTQHLKVVLLFAILLRHLQRFTVRTCHSWTKTPPQYAGVCIANNLLQTAAAEGLSYLSGVAIAGVELSSRQVAAPFVLIALFRWVFHPALEWVLLFQTDIGTAHLWFVLMVGLGRLYCAPIAALAPVGPVVLQCRVRDAAAAGAAALFLWRLTLAPLHINDLIGAGEVRRELYHLLFGDKNYLQIVHNLPLFVVGYATPPAALARLLGRLRRPRARAALCVLSFVLDPFVFGLFKSGSGISIAAQRETRPLIAYARAAARVGAFASALPDGRTPLTSAGRSQLLAYLAHDACFSVGALLIGALVPAGASLGWSAAPLDASAAWLPGWAHGVVAYGWAAAVLALYGGVCLAVQLALSHPRRLVAAAAGLRARLRAAVSRLRLGALVVARGVGGYDRVRTTAV